MVDRTEGFKPSQLVDLLFGRPNKHASETHSAHATKLGTSLHARHLSPREHLLRHTTHSLQPLRLHCKTYVTVDTHLHHRVRSTVEQHRPIVETSWRVTAPFLPLLAATHGTLDLHLRLIQVTAGLVDTPPCNLPPVVHALGNALTLTALHVCCPHAARPMHVGLTALGATAVITNVAPVLLQKRRRKRSAAQTHQHAKQPAQGSSSASPVADWLQRLASVSLLLWLANIAARTWHPPTGRLLDSITALAAVAAGYANTARDVAHGRLSGTAVEAAWKARHKWAAQRVAPLMTDLWPRPPLGWLVDVCKGASVAPLSVPLQGLTVSIEAGAAPQEPSHAPLRQDVLGGGDLGFCPLHLQLGCCPLAAAQLATNMAPSEAAGDVMARDAIADVAPLFGQGDHAAPPPPHTIRDQAALCVRAAYLLCIAMPFVLWGPLLLLMASIMQPAHAKAHGRRDAWASSLRTAAFWLLLYACRMGGAAFIKWAQWGSSREDVFPKEFCTVMAQLQDRAPTHAPRHTLNALKAAVPLPLPEVFRSLDLQPLASGSIAQVHLGELQGTPEGCRVAIKVRHPGVARRIFLDFQLMQGLAQIAEALPALRGMGLRQTMSQFSATMTAQADLRVEAAHLQRFYANFASIRSFVTQPQPLFATEAVLIESYEPGEGVAKYMGRHTPYNTDIVAKGVDTYLKMLLQDNFVHTDLHPGNILVRLHGEGLAARVQLVLLDFGLAEELTPEVRFRFISFLNLLAKGDADGATRHLLSWSASQTCRDPEALMQDMRVLLAEEGNIHSAAGIDLDAVLKATLRLARTHTVSIDSNYAALVIGVCVLVGFATSLDPEVNLMDAAAPCLFAYNVTGHVLGRLYG